VIAMMDDMRAKIAAALMKSPWAGLGGASQTGAPPVGDPGAGAPNTMSVPKGLTYPLFAPYTLFSRIAEEQQMGSSEQRRADRIARIGPNLVARSGVVPMPRTAMPQTGMGMGGGMGFMGNRRRQPWEIGLGGPMGRAPLARF
jgi:hypothetical protein